MDVPLPRAKSCVECRQQKVRCDRAARHPRPCTRCSERQLSCGYRADFTRQRSRRRLPTRARDSAAPSSPGLGTRSSPQSTHVIVSSTPVASYVNDTTSEDPRLWLLYSGRSVSIEHIELAASEVNDHFGYFVTRMHVHFPLLGNPFPEPEAILRASPLLFWTVIAINCSFRNRALYRTLQPHVRRLVTNVLLPYSPCSETRQALCLICLWPFESNDPNDDPVFVYAGMATHLALHMGLHRPLHSHEFKNINSVTEPQPSSPASKRLLTWYACIFVEHQLASKIGVPAGIRSYHQLLQQLSHHETESTSGPLPVQPLITQQVHLAVLREQFLNTIAWDGPSPSGLEEPSHRLNLLSRFSAELQRLSAEHAPLEILTLVLLHASHVAIGGFALAADLAALESHAAARRILVCQAVDSASAVLDLVTPLAWETLPTHILRAVLHAGILAGQIRRFQIQEEPAPVVAGYNAHQCRPSSLPSNSSSTSHYMIPLHRLEQIIDRALGLLRSIAYGKDFPTRAKIVLEAFRHEVHSAHSAPRPSAASQSENLLGTTNGPLGELPHARNVPTDTRDGASAVSTSIGVQFESRMAANLYWDAVEHEKGRHDWDQDEQGILRDVMSQLH